MVTSKTVQWLYFLYGTLIGSDDANAVRAVAKQQEVIEAAVSKLIEAGNRVLAKLDHPTAHVDLLDREALAAALAELKEASK